MCLLMKISWFFQFMFQIKVLKPQWAYCCLKNDNNSHYVFIKGFERFMFHTKKVKTEKICGSC